MRQTYYSILGLHRASTNNDVDLAWKRLARSLHPDAGGDATTFKNMMTAYTALRSSFKRKAYQAKCILTGVVCSKCGSLGFVSTGSKVRAVSPCVECGGTGYILTASEVPEKGLI